MEMNNDRTVPSFGVKMVTFWTATAAARVHPFIAYRGAKRSKTSNWLPVTSKNPLMVING